MIMVTDFYKSVLSSSKVESYATADMIDDSMHWLDRLLQDLQKSGSAGEHNQRDGFQGSDNHHDVALDWSHGHS